MSAESGITLKNVPEIVTAQPLVVPEIAKTVLRMLVLIGLVSFGILMVFGKIQEAWLSFHVNSFYWFGLAAASSGFAAVFTICNAEWSRPLRRVFESASVYLYYGIVPFLFVYIAGGYKDIFLWAVHPLEGGKGLWLSAPFFYLRDSLAILLLVYLSRKVIFLSIRQDIAAIRGGLTGVAKEQLSRWFGAEFDQYVTNSSAEAEIRESARVKGKLSPGVVAAYAGVMSLLGFDQMMSVDPYWVSTLFGAFLFMSAVYITMAWNSIGVAFLRTIHPLFKARITNKSLHDLGKLLFGFGIFWAYLFWSHYLTIWYGNMPEETQWLILRARLEPWHSFAWLVLWGCFLYPFMFGLSKDAKQIPHLLFVTASVVAISIWLLQYLIVVPSHFPNEIPINIFDFGISMGFAGTFLLLAISYLERVPLIPFGDLYFQPERGPLGEIDYN
jgi:hypothetical protein